MVKQLVNEFGDVLSSRDNRVEQIRAFYRQRFNQLQAKYDAAATNDENRRHWANADNLSPESAARPEVRKRLRSRARYECHESNSFAKGIILTLANDIVGKGPTLEVQVGSGSEKANRQIERQFKKWARSAGLSRKLRTMMTSTPVDGEVFAIPTTNMRQRHPVKLAIKVIEADQCTTPDLGTNDPLAIDGIRFDADGNPREYDFLKHHPGSDRGFFDLKPTPLPADQVIHYFREDRPGQGRGIPWVTPALPLFAHLRRFTLAVIAAAESAAHFAGVMQTDSPSVEPDEVDPMDAIEFEMRSMLTLPQGWKLSQLKAEQPTTTYNMFRDAILNEIARCLNMPFNKAAGNSSGYNYASGRLDHQTYFEFIDVVRQDLEEIVLDTIFAWWLDEAVLVPGVLPDDMGPIAEMTHSWRWPRHRSIDPLKQAMADKLLWDIGFLSDEEYCHENDLDPEDHYDSLSRQQKKRKKLKLPMPGENPLQPDVTRNLIKETSQQEDPAHA